MTDRLTQLQKLHAADPTDADLSYMIALEHAKADDQDQAVQWFDKTLELDANYHYAYYQKAKSLSMLGEDEDGVAVLDAGLAAANSAGDAKAVGELQELRAAIIEAD